MTTSVVERPVENKPQKVRPAIADCDVHPLPNSPKDLFPYLSRQWQQHLTEYGGRRMQGPVYGPLYPKGQPEAARLDAWPPGGRPGSSLPFMQKQYLDPFNVTLGVLTVINPHPGNYQNPDLAVALCRAVNDWQIAEWTSKDKRLKASIIVAYEHGAAAVAEIERLAGHPDFVQVLCLSRTKRPAGSRDYWAIYEAAERAGLPVAFHAFGNSGFPISAGGWPSFYVEEMSAHAQSCQSQVISLVIEGVFARFPGLKVVMIEGGFAWLPPLAWRLDTHWKRLKSETPHLKRLPSEYIRDHVWVTSQPMEEPENMRFLAQTIDQIGWDRILFASDYPHWDYDDPDNCLPFPVADADRARMFSLNARELYGAGA
jgi:predicted TIM-barrel fold metal-dependent hydrolase